MNHVDNHQLDVKPLVTQAVEVAIARGVIFRDCKQDKGGGSGMNKVEHARFTLWPSRVPRLTTPAFFKHKQTLTCFLTR